ncbi:MAG: LacI family transcriptional regulator [Spartobacteria bacterium]|nr:LacI family transcriptional regulator [Spartobacteria bacterium]
MKNATMKDIAELAGFSISTVSHVINKTRNVEEATRHKIMNAMRELNYVPNTIVRNINEVANKTIGAIIADIREDFFTEIVTALESSATEHGYNLIICDSQESVEKEHFHINTLISKGVDGIILAPVDVAVSYDEFLNSSIPVVLLDRYVDNIFADFIGIDNVRSAFVGTRYLLDSGCKNICFLGHHDQVYTMRKRLEGYRNALLDVDNYDPSRIFRINYHQDSTSDDLLNFFKSRPELDGIFCCTSTICFETITVLDQLGLNVPDDLRIVTYDGNKWFDYLRMPIPTIRQPTGEIGNEAVNVVVDRIENASSIKRQILLDFEFIIR